VVDIFRKGFESYKDAQTPRDHIVLQDMQVTQSGCGVTTYSESNAGSIKRQLNVENLKIISGWVISFANLYGFGCKFHMPHYLSCSGCEVHTVTLSPYMREAAPASCSCSGLTE
jgi:hypothetical protein